MGGEYDDLTREAGRPTALEQLLASQLDGFQPLESSTENALDDEEDDLSLASLRPSGRAVWRK